MNRLTRVLVLTAACLITGTAVAAVGEMHRSTTTPTAALRDASGSPRVAITIWYPAADDAIEKPLLIGPPDRPLFESGRAAPDAPVANGRRPVVLLSHGFGGTARVMGWFGTRLADAGFVVIAVDHPGSNARGPITGAGAALWWERAEDLKAAWNAMRRDDVIGPHLDASRLGVAGFSAGGFAALVAAGARAVTNAVAVDKRRDGAMLTADFAAFTHVAHFVVGYGMDDGGRLRTLPYIAAAG